MQINREMPTKTILVAFEVNDATLLTGPLYIRRGIGFRNISMHMRWHIIQANPIQLHVSLKP